MTTVFPKHVPHKLHLVTLIRSGIRRPYWEKRTLKKLGLTKRCRQVVLQNTPQVNEELATIKTLINIQPIVIAEDLADKSATNPTELQSLTKNLLKVTDNLGDLKLISGPFLDVNGTFNQTEYEKYLETFPENELSDLLKKPHLRHSELLNRDFTKEEEDKLTDKGKKIDLYFKKSTWKYPSRLENRLKNLSKY